MTALLCLSAALALQSDVAALIERLKSPDPRARRQTIAELVDRAREAVPLAMATLDDVPADVSDEETDVLVGRLGGRDWKGRDEAMQELIRLGRRVKGPLRKRLSGVTDLEVEWRIRAALAEIGEGEEKLRVEDMDRETALVEFLGLAGDGRGVPSLLKRLTAIDDGDAAMRGRRKTLRIRALEALGRLRGSLSDEQAASVAEMALDVLRELKEPSRETLTIVETLGRLKVGAAAAALEAFIRDGGGRDVDAKRRALRALADLGTAEAVRSIVQQAGGEDPYVRDRAIDILRELSGADFGIDPRTPAPEKLRVAREWWEKKFSRKWGE